MPDTEIERTIYKLELDGSAYIDGVDSVAASTKKLSAAQEESNKKLAELKTSQANYTKQLAETDAVIKANEQETLNLTKRQNELRDRTNEITARLKQLKAEYKGNGDEAKRLNGELKILGTESKNVASQLRGIATNTKEFRIEQTALKTSLANTNTALKTTAVEMKAAEAASGGFAKGATKAYSALRTIANVIPGIGIGGLVALIAGPLVNAITEWVTGMGEANAQLRLLQANQANVNEVMESAGKSASKQVVDLKILYQTATDVNLSIEERRKAVKALQQEFPDYFGNIKEETILNGNAKDAYDALALSIINTARATAAKTKIDELEAQRLQLSFQRQKVINATNQELLKASKAQATEEKIVEDGKIITIKRGAEDEKKVQQQKVIERRDAALQTIKDNDAALKAQEDFLIKFAGLTNIAHKIEEDDDKKYHDKKEKADKAQREDDFEKRKAELIAQISALAAIGAEEEEAIRQKFKDKLDKAILDINQDETTKLAEKNELILLATQLNYAELEKALRDFNDKKAKILIDAFNKEFDEQNAEDKKLLQQQLDAGAESIKAIEANEKAKIPPAGGLPFQGATKDAKKQTDELTKYADAVGKVANSVIQFWEAVNDAEQKSLDRSIELQQTRVDAAQRIADRGNAEYLRAETDRLNELNVARENAARKQLGIDAALQASQILVGITGAISKIATPGIGAAETISEIAIIIGALATGYGLVKSLNNNQPKLFKGTKYLERDGNPSGRDTIPVMANEGEAVIPTQTNKDYHPAVAAIYDRTIPAEELNRFVTTYHKIKPVAQPNYERIRDAATLHMEHDGKMSVIMAENNKLLKDNNELQQTVIHVLRKGGVNVSLDQHGFAVTQIEVIEKYKRAKRK